jgi:hypothetical protein
VSRSLWKLTLAYLQPIGWRRDIGAGSFRLVQFRPERLRVTASNVSHHLDMIRLIRAVRF